MAEPKITTVKKELSARCEQINGSGGYYTKIGREVVRGPAPESINESDLPITYVRGGEISGEGNISNSQLSGFSIVFESHDKATTQNPEDHADMMLDDLHRAIEQTVPMSQIKSSVIKKQPEFVAETIGYPGGSGKFVSVSVEYKISISRGYGQTTNQ